MLKRGFGYSQVQTADKQVGYVGTSDIQPLQRGGVEGRRPPLKRRSRRKKRDPNRRSPAVVGEYTIPLGAGSRVTELPEPDEQAAAKPGDVPLLILWLILITARVFVVARQHRHRPDHPRAVSDARPDDPEEYEKLGSYALIGLPDDLYPIKFVNSGETKTPVPDRHRRA